MRHPSSVFLVSFVTASALLVGCGGAGGRADPPAAGEGRLVVARRGGERILDAEAQATYCTGDSLLVIVGLGRDWGAALAVRGRFPMDSARTFTLRPWLGGDGTAAAVLRSVEDSVHQAVVGLRGSVRLEPGRRASGRFEIGAAPLPKTSVPLHLVGAFRGLPTTDTSGTCGAWARTP